MISSDHILPADIVRFYLEAGVETPLQDEPVNRLAEIRAPLAERQVVTAKPAVHALAPDATVDVSAAKTLDDLKALIEAFDGCGLKKTASRVVFADGVPGSRVMLVGDVPEREDDEIGKPFSGKLGQLLDLMLKSIGLDRSSVYLANTIYWRTPGGRPPSNDETAQCLPFIRRQIELAKPEFLVLLGAVSARTLLGSQAGIMQLRGNWAEINLPELGQLAALPILAPDYLLRNPAHKRLAWADLLALKSKLKNT